MQPITLRMIRCIGTGKASFAQATAIRTSWYRSLSRDNTQDHASYSTSSIPLRTGRPRLVVLGTGWAAARLLKDIDPKLYDLTVVSKRNHMVFTPLLASATVGTLNTQSVAVHITAIQKALFMPQNQLYIAEAKEVFPDRKVVECVSDDGLRFFVDYDVLAICTGSQGSTFGIPGVQEHAHFLRDIKDAKAIHDILVKNVAKAGIPGRKFEDYERLLHIVIVGGGPTGVEMAGELTDFINEDLKRLYPERARAMRVTLIEAKEMLGSFDASLREYAAKTLIKRGVLLRKGVVKCMDEKVIELQDGSHIPYGLCIWSTGVGPTPFSLALPLAKTSVGRLAVDKFLRALSPPKQSPSGRVKPEGEAEGPSQGISMLADEDTPLVPGEVKVMPNVYALGDVCANTDRPLPALAQVAEQQGKYLAATLNKQAKAELGWQPTEEFVYRSLGSMATVGGRTAVLELQSPSSKTLSMAGFASWVAWRSAYLTRLGSVPKRMSVAFDWTMALLFGRDMSRW